jgi:hypothetical protein
MVQKVQFLIGLKWLFIKFDGSKSAISEKNNGCLKNLMVQKVQYLRRIMAVLKI